MPVQPSSRCRGASAKSWAGAFPPWRCIRNTPRFSMSWAQIRGREHLVTAFHRAVERGRLAHAYLFVGPPGVGKSLFAHELAKAILCETPPLDAVLAACDRCDSC